jgi:hypothetical protein
MEKCEIRTEKYKIGDCGHPECKLGELHHPSFSKHKIQDIKEIKFWFLKDQ